MIANIPLLRSGQMPVMIPVVRRAAYMASLGAYSDRTGELSGRDSIWPDGHDWSEFERFCARCADFCDTLIRYLLHEEDQPIGSEFEK